MGKFFINQDWLKITKEEGTTSWGQIKKIIQDKDLEVPRLTITVPFKSDVLETEALEIVLRKGFLSQRKFQVRLLNGRGTPPVVINFLNGWLKSGEVRENKNTYSLNLPKVQLYQLRKEILTSVKPVIEKITPWLKPNTGNKPRVRISNGNRK